MRWKRPSVERFSVAVLLFILVMYGVSAVYALLTPALRLTASVAKTSFQMEERVKIAIVLENVGLWPITFDHDYSFFDFAVYDEAGKEIFRWENVTVQLLRVGLRSTTLWPTQTRTETLPWDQEGISEDDLCQVPKGTYTIVALVRVVYISRVFLLEAQPIVVTIE